MLMLGNFYSSKILSPLATKIDSTFRLFSHRDMPCHRELSYTARLSEQKVCSSKGNHLQLDDID